MIRPFTCVCMLLAAGSGLYLYQTKHRSVMLDRDIARTLKAAEDVRAHSGVLRAEWALVSERDRLGELAQRFLELKPLAPSQFVAMADLAQHLPPPGAVQPQDAAPEPMDVPADPTPAQMSSASPPPTPVTQAPAQAGPRVAAPSPPKPTVTAAAKLAPGPRAPQPALARPATVAAAQSSASASGNPSVARIVQAAAPAQSAYVTSALGNPAGLGSSAFSGSALGGMRPALPPPVPISATPAASPPNYWTGH